MTRKLFYPEFWDWKLLGVLLLTSTVFASVYNTYAIWLIGSEIPDPSGLAILAQYKFVELLLEVFQEALVLPMFYYLAVVRGNLERRLGVCFCLTLLVVGGCVVPLLAFASQFVSLIDTPKALADTTTAYIRLNLVASLVGLFAQILLVCIKSSRLYGLIILFQILALGLNLFFNALFIGGYEFSLGYGVLGHAVGRIVAESLLLVVGGGLFLYSMRRRFSLRLSWTAYRFGVADIREYLAVVWGSGVDVLVRNLAYSYMILFLINQMGAAYIQGYYLAMHIIWSFGMLPILLLSEATRVLVSTHATQIGKVWGNAMLLTAAVAVLWLVGFVFWEDTAAALSSDAQTVAIATTAAKWLLLPYLLLIFNLVTDSIFYGSGKTQYLAYQSLLVNGLVYGLGFLLYQSGFWTPDFQSVLVLFGIGILFDSVLTMWYAGRVSGVRVSG